MYSNKILWDERIRSSRIKKYTSRDGVDTERTQHDLGCLLSWFGRHMVHPSNVGWSSIGSLIVILLLWGWGVLLLWALIGIVTHITTTVASIGVVCHCCLHQSIVGHTRTWCLGVSLLLGSLITKLLLVLGTLLILVLVALRVLAWFHWLGGLWFLGGKPC